MDQSGQGKTYRVVCLHDPAVDWDACDVGEYANSRDANALKFKAGARPRWFEFKRLSRSDMLHIAAYASASDEHRRDAAFARGIVRIEHPDGGAVSGPLGEDDLNALEHSAIQEIGEIVLERSRVPLAFAPTYVPLPMSRAAWVSSRLQSAGPSKTSKAQSSVEQAQPSPAATSESAG